MRRSSLPHGRVRVARDGRQWRLETHVLVCRHHRHVVSRHRSLLRFTVYIDTSVKLLQIEIYVGPVATCAAVRPILNLLSWKLANRLLVSWRTFAPIFLCNFWFSSFKTVLDGWTDKQTRRVVKPIKTVSNCHYSDGNSMLRLMAPLLVTFMLGTLWLIVNLTPVTFSYLLTYWLKACVYFLWELNSCYAAILAKTVKAITNCQSSNEKKIIKRKRNYKQCFISVSHVRTKSVAVFIWPGGRSGGRRRLMKAVSRFCEFFLSQRRQTSTSSWRRPASQIHQLTLYACQTTPRSGKVSVKRTYAHSRQWFNVLISRSPTVGTRQCKPAYTLSLVTLSTNYSTAECRDSAEISSRVRPWK